MQAWTMAFIVFLLVCGCQDPGMNRQQEKDATRGQEKTNAADKSSVMRPPIDLAAPTNTQTATFALG